MKSDRSQAATGILSKPKQWFHNVITSGFYDTYPLEITRKIILLNIVSITAVINLIPLGLLAIKQQNYPLGIFDFTMAVLLGGCLFYLRKSGHYQIVCYLGVVVFGVFFAFLFFTGGVNNTAFVWLYTYPLFALFLLGSIKGTLATLLLFMAVVVFLAVEPAWPGFTSYSRDMQLRFIPSFLLVSAYAYFFELVREKTQRKLTQKNEELSQTVGELQTSRQALESAHLELEQRVKDRTADLNRSNLELHAEIVDRKKAEKALQTSNERFLTVLNSIDANVHVVDINTYEILFMNRRMQEDFGKDIVGQSCFQAIRNCSDPCTDCAIRKLFDEQGQPIGKRVWQDYNSTTKRWYMNFDRVIRWIDGRQVRLQVATDMTKRKEAEDALQRLNEELEQKVAQRTNEFVEANAELKKEISQHRRTAEKLQKASQAKSQFLANMSHELRTPLNHIIGFTELVVDKNLGDLHPTQEEYLNDVLSSSRHLLALINDILDLSKVEAGKMELDLSAVDIESLLTKSLVMIKEKAIRHGIQLRLDVTALPDPIYIDERKIKQVIYNLLSNAAKFTPDHGTIVLQGRSLQATNGELIATSGKKIRLSPSMAPDTASTSNYLEICVQDTGIGIRFEELEKIFNVFEQVDQQHVPQGTGLGLSLAKRFVNLHGGHIWAESRGENQGSMFQFVIPIHDREQSQSPEARITEGAERHTQQYG